MHLSLRTLRPARPFGGRRTSTASDLGGLSRGVAWSSGRARRRRRPRSHGGLKGVLAVAAFLLLVLMGVLVDAYYQSNRIYGQLEVAMPSLRQASESLARGRLPAGDPFGKADRAVRRAVATVNHARFTFKLAGAIPLFGRPVQAIRHGVTAAGEVTGAALVTQRAVSDLLGEAARTPGSVRASDTPLYRGGAVDVQLLESLGRRLDAVVAHLRAAGREIAEIRSIPLLPKVNEVRRQTSRDTSRAIQVAERMRAGPSSVPRRPWEEDLPHRPAESGQSERNRRRPPCLRPGDRGPRTFRVDHRGERQ
jgi:hypothetical protein